MSRIDSAGSRVIGISDERGNAGILASSVSTIRALDYVDWVIALGSAVEVYNAAFGSDPSVPVIAARTIYGDVNQAFTLEEGRFPQYGEAVVGPGAQERLGMHVPVGGIRTRISDVGVISAPVVGTYSADPVVEYLDGIALIHREVSKDSRDQVRFLYVMASDARMVATLSDALAEVIQAENRRNVSIEQPKGLTNLRAAVAGEMRQGAQQLTLMVLAAGLILVCITMFGAVAARRRDFGRRRVLGASRSSIVSLVLIQAITAGAIGATLGCLAGLVFMSRTSGLLPGAEFVFGLFCLAIITSAIGSVPPALSAAFADPVRIVRVP